MIQPYRYGPRLAICSHDVHLSVLIPINRSDERGLSAASHGDRDLAWHGNGVTLSYGTDRSPFLGSGMASPRAFESQLCDGTLLLGSDGLFKYTDPEVGESSVPRVRPRTSSTP